jgi:uncharacterized protein (TIGR03083 family)
VPLAPDRVGALRQERAELLALCRDLDDADWQTDSAAKGWRVQDVVAHIGSGCRAVFTPAILNLSRSKDLERTSDFFVNQRRDWAPAQTLAEYERWSGRLLVMAGAISRTPLAAFRMPLAELGSFPAGLLLGGAMVFDHHTHLRHDIMPALGKPVPGSDANRMAVVLEWMFSVLGNQLSAARPSWLLHPVAILLEGPGGGSWLVRPNGSVVLGRADSATTLIAGYTLEFPEWATRRVDWRDRDVKISGDVESATRFLDALHVV